MSPWSLLFIVGLFLTACTAVKKIDVPTRGKVLTGSSFYQIAATFNWQQRDSLAVEALMQGNLPSFMQQFIPVHVTARDSASGKIMEATYYVAPDYLSVGTDDDWARINITPLAAQKIADRLECFLPTKKMVDDIHNSAAVKLEPVPMFAFRDSTATMWQHHLIIEGQRQGRKGLIAGIKKDVVISGKVSRDPRTQRVAIYGWHKTNGKPIQPLYTGHVNWWVDYSQGIRLVWYQVKVNGSWMDYREVLSHPMYKRLLCDEEFCDFYGYWEKE